MQLLAITETYFQGGKIIRKEETKQFTTFDGAAEGLQYGKVTEMEYDNGAIEIVRTESKLIK